jgi:hypothetical protein
LPAHRPVLKLGETLGGFDDAGFWVCIFIFRWSSARCARCLGQRSADGDLRCHSALGVSHRSLGRHAQQQGRAQPRCGVARRVWILIGVVLASITACCAWFACYHRSVFYSAFLVGWLAWTRCRANYLQDSPAVWRCPPPAVNIWLPFPAPTLLHSESVGGCSRRSWHCQRRAGHAGIVLFKTCCKAPPALEPTVFWAAIFLSAALSIPLWLAVVKRLGLAATAPGSAAWVLAIAVFGWATQVSASQTAAFGGDLCPLRRSLGRRLALARRSAGRRDSGQWSIRPRAEGPYWLVELCRQAQQPWPLV